MLYKGLTSNLEERMRQHRLGQSLATRYFGSFKLIYTETHQAGIEARRRELFLKSGIGREWLQKHNI